MNEGLKNYLMRSDAQTVINAFMTDNITKVDAFGILLDKLPPKTCNRLVELAEKNKKQGWTDLMVTYSNNVNYRIMDRDNLLAIGSLATVLEELVNKMKLKAKYRNEPGYIKALIDTIHKSGRYRLERAG